MDTKKIFDVLALLFVIVTHELGHGYAALLNGDKTAKNADRLSFNPLKHLDLMGTLFLIVFKFGWAKPVPIDISQFKNRNLGLFTVSLAGIFVNMLTAIISIAILMIFGEKLGDFAIFFTLLASYGILFAVFNLIPVPPLDGSKIVASFLPDKYKYYMFKYEKYFYIVLVAVLILNRKTLFVSKISNDIFLFIVETLSKII